MKAKKIVAGVSAAALAAFALPFAAAADEPEGYVSFTAVKSTVGQGFTVEPVKVPLYEGDKGVDIVKRAVGEDGVVFTESDYGAYITGFADDDTGAEIPAAIAAVCTDMTDRNNEGYLSAFDYTAESGWSYFINGEYTQVGIVDYEPQDGDVLEFRFTVYGYGADLGIDNSEWGGAAALTEQVNASELIRKCADVIGKGNENPALEGALNVLAEYGAAQSEIDAAYAALASEDMGEVTLTTEAAPDNAYDEETGVSAPSESKGSLDTGVEGAAAALGVIILACGAVAVSRKSR